MKEDEKKKKEEEFKLKGRPGKGEKFDTYVRFCRSCMIEYTTEILICSTCKKDTITS